MPDLPLARLLIVDDEPAQMKALCDTLEPEGYSTTGFISASGALAALREEEFDLVLSDLMMPEMDGISLLRAALEIDPSLVAVVMTGHGTIDTAVRAMQAGAIDYILKPFRLSVILPVLSRALAVRRLRMENIQLHEAVGIYKMSMAVAFALDSGAVLQMVAEAALEQSRIRGVSILLPTEGGDELRAAVTRGEDAPFVEGTRIPFSPALSGWVARHLELVGRQDEPGDARSVSAALLEAIPGGVSVPMLASGKLVGILVCNSEHPRQQIAPGQERALNILASAAASALERTSLLERLHRSKERYRRLTDNAPDIIFRYDLHPRPCFTYVNPTVEAVTGYSPEEHYADPDLGLKTIHPEDHPLMEKVLRGDCPSGSAMILRLVHRNGSVSWMEQRIMLVRDQSGQLVAVEGVARDITGRRLLEEELRQAQKLEAIGRMASGVAHDFNNLLAIINGYSEQLLEEFVVASPTRENLEEIRKAGEQAAALTRQLTAFGRRELLQPRVFNVNAIVESSEKMFQRIIGQDVELVTSLDPDLGSVKADAGQIEQILMNLVVNARDAMSRGGRLTIETRNVALDAGPCVMLAVSDTGSGMDPATQSRIFEPFFTTKETGRGTGLGLSIVYGAVTQSNGTIRVYSEPGKGTTFRIHLPRIEEGKTSAGAAG